MPRVGPLQEAFNAGEFSPRMEGRVSFDKYRLGGSVCENILLLPQGGFSRRSGTRHVAEVADSTKRSRLVDFQFSTEQAYALEFGDGSLRFFREQGRAVIADTDASITNGDFTSNITGWTDQSTGAASIAHDSANGMMNLVGAAGETSIAEQAISIGASYRNTLHAVKFRVSGAPGDAIKLRIGTSAGGSQIVDDFEAADGYHVYSFDPDGNGTVYLQFRNEVAKTIKIDDVSLIDDAALEIDSPYSEADVATLKRAQSADVVYFCRGMDVAGQLSKTKPVYRLERFGASRWSLERVLFEDGPYFDENTTATTLTAGATSGYGVTVTASATEGINGGQGFLSTDVGRLVRIYNTSDSKNAWAVITAVASTTSITVDHKGDVNFQSASPKTKWQLGRYSDTTGHPSAVAFVQQRLALAATANDPQTIWLSQAADIENFRPDDQNGAAEDDDAITFTFAAKKVNTILWMEYRRRLTVGTAGGEWTIESEGATLTPTDITAYRQSGYGSALTVEPIDARNRQVFVQRARRQVFEFAYSFNSDSYEGFDLTVLADRVLKSGAREMAYASQPDSQVWIVREDGQCAVLTYQPDQEVVGWARQIMGGSFSGGAAVIESVITIPGKNGSGQVKDSTARDEVWLIVKRTIDGQTKRYVEFIEKAYNGDEDAAEDAYYFDSLVTYDGASASVITGLDHLEGETVKVWADGYLQADQTVESGQITLERAASVVQIGLGYTHKWRSLKIPYGAQAGSGVGRTKSVEKVGFVLMETADGSIRYGSGAASLQLLSLRGLGDATDFAVDFFTGETELQPFSQSWGTDPRIYVEGDHGPCTVLGVTFDMDINERM
jgi:hypothetical protein